MIQLAPEKPSDCRHKKNGLRREVDLCRVLNREKEYLPCRFIRTNAEEKQS